MNSGCASHSATGPSIVTEPDSQTATRLPIELIACPGTPNCVASTADDPKKIVQPFELGDVEKADYQNRLINAIEADGGSVKEVREGYIWATYTSTVFRFVDDIEWLFNADHNVFEVRSASRVGRSDFGVNAKRVERLRQSLPSSGRASAT